VTRAWCRKQIWRLGDGIKKSNHLGVFERVAHPGYRRPTGAAAPVWSPTPARTVEVNYACGTPGSSVARPASRRATGTRKGEQET